MDPELQKQYFDLRKKLNKLNYATNFGVDSIDLVQQLFGDLISTTESYNQLQEKEQKLSQDLSLAQSQLFPLRKENAKLTRDNHQLHVDTIRLNEELSTSELNYTAKIRETDEKLKNAEYIITCKDEEISRAEKKWSKLREAYESLAAASLSSGGAKIKRSAKMTFSLNPSNGVIETKSPEVSNSRKHVPATTPSTDLYLTTSPDPTDRYENSSIISTLRQQIENLEKDLHTHIYENKSLKQTISRREEELLKISRSSGVLDEVGGQSMQIENLLAADASNQRIIEQLNGQVDFLNEHLSARELQLSRLSHELNSFRETKAESEYRLTLLDEARKNNATLSNQLRALESKLENFNIATDPNNVLQAPPHPPPPSAISPYDEERSSKTGEKLETDLVMRRVVDERNQLQNELNRLQQNVVGLETGDSVMHGRLIRTETARQKLREDLEKSQNDYAQLHVQLKDAKTLIEIQKNEINSLNSRYQNLQNQAEREASDADNNRSSILALESQNSVLSTSLKRSEVTVDNLKLELQQMRKNLNDLTIKNDETTLFLRRLEKEKERNQRKMESATSELLDVQERLKNIENERNYFEDSYHQQEDKYKRSELQIMALNEALDMRNSELSVLVEHSHKQQVQLQHQQQIINNTDAASLNSSTTPKKGMNLRSPSLSTPGSAMSAASSTSLTAENNKLNSKLREVQKNYEMLTTEYETMTRVHQSAELQRRSLALQFESLVTERNSLEEMIHGRDEKIVELEGQIDNLNREHELVVQRMKLSTATSNVSSQHDETISNTLLEKQQLITRLQGDIQLLTLRHGDAINSNNMLQSDVLMLESQHDQTSNMLRAKEVELQKMKNEIELLQVQYSSNSNVIRNYEKQLNDQNEMISTLQNKVKLMTVEKDKILKQLEHLQVLYGNMNHAEKEEKVKWMKLNDNVAELNHAIKEQEEAMSKLTQDCRSKDKTIEDLQQALQAIDIERDSLQCQLDDICENEQSRLQLISSYETKLNDYSQFIASQEKKLSSITKEYNHEVRKCEVLGSKAKGLHEEAMEYRRRLDARSSEVGAASEDLMLMTRENQSLTNELAIASDEREKMRRKLQELNENNYAQQQSIRALEIERADLIDTYRTCLQEKRKLDSDINAMSSTKLKLSQQLLEQQNVNSDLQGELASKMNAERNMLAERSALLLQVESLNNLLVENTRKLDNKDMQLNSCSVEIDSLRQTISTLQQRSQVILNRTANSSDANKILQGRISLLESERDSLKNMLDMERKKSNDIAQVLAMSRSRDALSKSSPSQGVSTYQANNSIIANSDIDASTRSLSSGDFPSETLANRLKKGIAETSDHRGGFQEKGESLGRTRTVPPPSLASNADRAIAQTSSKVTSQKTTSNGETSHHAFKHDSGFEESVSSLTQDVSHRLGVYLPTSGASNQYNAIFQGITAEEKNIASSSQQQRAREAELLGISDDYSSDEDFE